MKYCDYDKSELINYIEKTSPEIIKLKNSALDSNFKSELFISLVDDMLEHVDKLNTDQVVHDYEEKLMKDFDYEELHSKNFIDIDYDNVAHSLIDSGDVVKIKQNLYLFDADNLIADAVIKFDKTLDVSDMDTTYNDHLIIILSEYDRVFSKLGEADQYRVCDYVNNHGQLYNWNELMQVCENNMEKIDYDTIHEFGMWNEQKVFAEAQEDYLSGYVELGNKFIKKDDIPQYFEENVITDKIIELDHSFVSDKSKAKAMCETYSVSLGKCSKLKDDPEFILELYKKNPLIIKYSSNEITELCKDKDPEQVLEVMIKRNKLLDELAPKKDKKSSTKMKL